LAPTCAFSRVCRAMKQDRTIDKLEIDGGTAKFQFTRKAKLGDRIKFDYECTVFLDLETGALSCPESPALERNAQKLFAHEVSVRNAQDVTRMIQKLFQQEADLYSINPRKGVAYFVPEKYTDFTAKMEKFLDAMRGRLWRFPVPKGLPEGDAAVREAVTMGLSSLLAELDETVANRDPKAVRGRKPKYLERWEGIKYKVEAYSEYLGQQQAGLLEKLAKTRAAIAEKILGDGEESPEDDQAEFDDF